MAKKPFKEINIITYTTRFIAGGDPYKFSKTKTKGFDSKGAIFTRYINPEHPL